MKKLIIALMALLAICSCTKKEPSPVEAAIKDKVSAQLGELQYLEFSELTLVDSCTFADEIARRRKTMELRYNQNVKLAKEYNSQYKANNAQAKWQAAVKDLKVLDGLSGIEERLAAHDSLGKTELYRYKFSARAKPVGGSSTEIKDMYIAITPSFEIIGMDYKKDGVLKAGGSLIPGYQALFEND